MNKQKPNQPERIRRAERIDACVAQFKCSEERKAWWSQELKELVLDASNEELRNLREALNIAIRMQP